MQSIKDKINGFLKDESDQGIKKRQDVFFFGALSLLILFGGGFFLVTSVLGTPKMHEAKEDVQVRKIETANASVDVKKVWVDRLEGELELVKRQNNELKTLIEAMAHKQLMADKVQEESSLMNTHNAQRASQIVQNQPQILTTDHLQPDSQEKEHVHLRNGATQKKAFKLNRVTFNLVGSHKPKNTIDHFVPAGTFVKGRLISGVVASTAVSGASNPQPIHMELTHYGNLPREFKTDLKQCFLIGSAYGDLPSERVYMRLETLSCVERRTQEVIEIKVDGYVSGEDGANGMRGHVVDKSGPAIRNAFLGGFLSGVGEFIGATHHQTSQISPFGVTSQQALSASQMLQGGAGKGVGNAMEKMADFYIKRAEQLQPVIEIEPGREIDVVFKAGFDMNQTLYRNALKQNQDRERISNVSRDFNGD
ncbi:MAG: TraB/VirB10 family protein [Alphaproteobacteria bacterium]|nr:TraB/VirB10 family protein [Alphaproteobacteria bacterium]